MQAKLRGFHQKALQLQCVLNDRLYQNILNHLIGASHDETCSFCHKVLTEEEIYFLQIMDLERWVGFIVVFIQSTASSKTHFQKPKDSASMKPLKAKDERKRRMLVKGKYGKNMMLSQIVSKV